MAEDLKQFIKEEGEKTRRHFDVASEEIKGEIQQVAEGVVTNTQQLKRIESRVESLEPMKDDVIAIKNYLGSSKSARVETENSYLGSPCHYSRIQI